MSTGVVSTATTWVDPRVAIEGSARATVIYHGAPVPAGASDQFDNRSIYTSRVRGPGPGGSWSDGGPLLGHPDQTGDE